MAKALRVFELAKELGVKSKVIVERCTEEGVPNITNHMSTVKVGLAVTIREWFANADSGEEEAAQSDSEGGVATATQTVAKPARAKAVKRKATARKAKPKAKETEEPATDESAPTTQAAAPVEAQAPAAQDDSATQQAEDTSAQTTPPEARPAEIAPTEQAQPAADEAKPGEETEPQAPTPQEQPAVAAETTEPTEPAKADDTQTIDPVKPVGVQNVPERPKTVMPVGKQLEKPKQATLKGPKVVRVERPDPVSPRPTRRAPGGGGGPRGGGGGQGGGGPQPPMQDDPGFTRSRGPARGRGAGGGPGAGGGDGRGGGRGGQGGRRGTNARRSRSNDNLLTGPSQLSKADMEDLDAKLKGASGYLKQRRRLASQKGGGGAQAMSPVVTGGKVEIEEPITIKSLSAATGIKSNDAIKYLFKKGVMATINSSLDSEMAMEIAMEYEIELDVKEKKSAEEVLQKVFADRERTDVRSRPPVVTVLGHVDHGKTSLLDRIRAADVAAHEAGGITQHIGAYRVTIDGSDNEKKTVVFLDTPGHEAFTAMRARGAQMTDMIVLVCAADDGVMPQTVESINHAKAAGVPIIVALNKIDRPEATDDKVQEIYGQLAANGLNPTAWGGETEVVKTSAITGEGVNDLLELLDLQAEVLELTADFGGNAVGTVVEGEMQPGRGAVARILVQEGQIKVGSFAVAGRAFGRVRDMTDDRGSAVREAGPATPLEISGLDELPDAGDRFYVTGTLKQAEDVAKQTRDRERETQLASKTKVTLDNFADTLKAGQVNLLRVVLKADVQGSLDVLRESLEKLGNDEVAVRVIHAAVGGITESDVLLADASEAVVVGFQVASTGPVREIAEARTIDIRTYRVIYDLIDDIKAGLEGMLAPERREEQTGEAHVQEVFKISKLGLVAGCMVTEGSIERESKVRVVRDGVVVTDERKLNSLRRVKEDVKEVRVGTECGIRIEGYDDVKSGDRIICYKVTEIARKLS
ncbi:translation initiation factor IF-2 [Mucisphaera calidilacus]|uniref:Translation initiation factor IF-2 n=1 Tax=Mucisphaera calidilacus TaxID=2527982 RepID=A0A518BW87_9BACT|nr:translation initiation factor IF-2 [Mucisphaera calidilacus]QDU71221.1 Translation initiation factor IF-2 [Mucisphaera calidilacus]